MRWWPNGRWTTIAPFPVRFSTDADVVVDPSLTGLVDGTATQFLGTEKPVHPRRQRPRTGDTRRDAWYWREALVAATRLAPVESRRRRRRG